MSDNEDTSPQSASYLLQPRRCELLCFVVEKSKMMPFDQLVKVCADFYQESEIMSARSELDPLLPSRLPRRSGAHKCRATVEDIVKTCLNPAVQLPVFYAVELSRLPPVSVNHCDMSAILAELQSLRAEVREVSSLREEVADLRAQLRSLSPSNLVQKDDDDFPPLAVGGCSNNQAGHSFSSLVREIPAGHPGLKLAVQTRRPQKQEQSSSKVTHVVGKATDEKLKSVATTRTVDLFVSRLHPLTTRSEVTECAEAIATAGSIIAVETKCVQLKSRVEGLYASFHVSLRVDATQLSRAVTVMMNEEAWPCGIFIKRYFAPKNGDPKQ